MQSINVQKVSNTFQQKKAPDAKKIKLKFDYSPSQDGIDFNLLILLHGLGDTKAPFAKLGKQLKLPQTATLSVQAPEVIPFMDGCYQWYPSFNMFTGELLTSSNPERMKGVLQTRILMNQLLEHLIQECGFNPANIFFFGFSQGGTIALDTVMFGKVNNLGGVVSISGYLLEEHAKQTNSNRYNGYILITQGEKDETINKSSTEKKVQDIKKQCGSSAEINQVFISNKEHTMPTGEVEWRSIHTFFGKYMPRRNIELENMSDVYLVNP